MPRLPCGKKFGTSSQKIHEHRYECCSVLSNFALFLNIFLNICTTFQVVVKITFLKFSK